MKTNTLINQYIRLGFFFVLTFLLHTSCETCHSGELQRDKDPEVAKLTMQSLEVVGYVNGEPMFDIEGKIEENHIPEISKLCLLVIPKGNSVVEAIEEFQGKNEKEKLGNKSNQIPYIPLLKSSGAVYYVKDTLGNQQDKIMGVSALVSKLPPRDYEACLLLDNKGYGTVFSNVESLTIHPTDLSISISMINAQAGRDGLTQNTKILAEADIKNYSTSVKQGWFIITKKGLPSNPLTVIATCLKEGQQLSTVPKFTLNPNKEAIVHPFIPKAGNDNRLDAIDDDFNKKLFEKGATYTIAACFLQENKVDGAPSYVVSNTKEIVILKPEAELDIKQCSIEALYKCLDADEPTDLLSIVYTTKIIKQLGTYKPKVGLLFVKTPKVPDTKVIEAILQQTPTGEYYENGKDIAYLIGDVAEDDTNELQNKTTFPPTIRLELGENYNVYFFLRDGEGKGEIFLSKNNIALQVPKADFQINGFSVDLETNKLVVKAGFLVNSQTFSATHDKEQVRMGYILTNTGNKVSSAILEKIVNLVQTIPDKLKPESPDKNIPDTLFENDILFLTEPVILDSSKLVKTFRDVYGNVPDSSPGATKAVHGVWACENAIFYKKLNNQFNFYNPLENTKAELGPVSYNGVQYEMEHGADFSNGKIFKQLDGHGSKEYIPYRKDGYNLYTEILKLGIKGDHAKENIKKFIQGMPGYVDP